MSKSKHIVVGVSGGVDSAVSAWRLMQAGHQVTGIFMQNWDPGNQDPHCTAEQDLSDARAVCDQIGIPFHVVSFADTYWHDVFQTCLDQWNAGNTPNPDVLCNQKIKFKAFLEHALALGADQLATGHYAKIRVEQGVYQLCKPVDTAKDQTYFLHTLGQHALAHSCFPLAELTKPEVRAIAAELGLVNHAKKDSTGLCFVGERKFKPFIQEYLLSQPGPMRTPEGDELGQHDGLMFYTLGQRKGLNIGGQRAHSEEAWYVLDKDIKNNVLIVGQGHNHPLLFKQRLVCNNVHWIAGQAPAMPLHCYAKTRYRQSDQACVVTALPDGSDNNHYEVVFATPQRAITPGQSVVFYQGDVCLGGGIILSD